jgi:HAD superfamily hydrolase (TIGR01509 family)
MRLIDQAHDLGLTLAIVTTSARKSVEALFQYVLPQYQRKFFDILICGEDVSRKKPDPEAYQLALQQLNLAPEQCIALEDSANGLAAASLSGIPTLIVYNEWTKEDDFTTAWRVVENLNDRGDGQPVTVEWLAQ